MKFMIYGVGRSGTKAVQLYLSYMLAQRSNQVWINYEPYFWLNRFAQSINYEGFYHHTHSPHLCSSPDELSKDHIRFLRKLDIKEMDSVTKFIRGNGRINAINQVIQPDYTIIIVRDLYQVLTSVLKTQWDFWSIGFEFSQSWDEFIDEVRKKRLIENFDWCLERITDRTDQNAFYWYVMNKAALKTKSANTFILNYKDIDKVEHIARQSIDSTITASIQNELFNGDNIHENYPLLSRLEDVDFTVLINSLIYKSKLMNKYDFYLKHRRYGSKAGINMQFRKIQSPRSSGTKISIEKKDLYEFFTEDIFKTLSGKEWANRSATTLTL